MKVQEKIEKYATPNYGVRDFVVVKGKGSWLFDENGKKYLDFGSGIAVNCLGHSNARWVKAVTKQASELAHCSNLYLTKPHADLLEKIVTSIGTGKAFICNSGTEANEALIKVARLYGKSIAGAEAKKYKIITAINGFHGRTLGAVAATAQEKIQKGFAPNLEGFLYAEYNNLDSVEKLMDESVAAVLVEPVQGESGVTPATKAFLKGLKSLCKKHNALLLFDEVQCGFGRCGAFLASQVYGVKPDGVSMAKGLGGGFPIGAIWLNGKLGNLLTAGTHGTTFGGNPLACTAALASFAELESKKLVQNAKKQGDYLAKKLEAIVKKYPKIVKLTRGLGLMRAVLFNAEYSNIEICAKLRQNGLILIPAGANALRFLPPLNITASDINKAVKILDKTLEKL